ncbi:MAG: Gx transporter family protein [Clostridia bacterium]|nr:Gx transporter family protein [Clostridia bacterium]
MRSTRVITLLGVSTAAAIVLSYVETLIPVSFAIPGIKLGLSNAVALFLLYKLDWKAAGAVNLIRVLISGLLFGSIASLAYSASGAVLSMLVMAILKRSESFSAVGCSAAGAIAHNFGQLLMAVVILSAKEIMWYLPALIVSGALTGAAVGAATALLIKKIKID